MPTQIRLQSYQLADLAAIRDIDPPRLEAVLDRLRGFQPRPLQPKDLHRAISETLGEQPELARQILRPLLSLYAIIRQRKLTADDVIAGIRHGIESSDPGWEQAEVDRWHRIEPLFKELLQSPSVRSVATALDLTYEHENLLQGARVITDIRPVFSEDALSVEGAVVSHTLRIRYDSTEGDHSVSIGVDESDIRELERQCKRALQKAQTARELMATRANVPTVISGDDADEEA